MFKFSRARDRTWNLMEGRGLTNCVDYAAILDESSLIFYYYLENNHEITRGLIGYKSILYN